MIKCKNVIWFLIVFSLLVIFVLPCVSFATSISDFHTGNVDNTLKMSLDSHGLGGNPVLSPTNRGDEQAVYGHGDGDPRQTLTSTHVPAYGWLISASLIGFIGIKRKTQNRLSSTSQTYL